MAMVLDSGTAASAPVARTNGVAWAVFAMYFSVLVLGALLLSALSGHFYWTMPLGEFNKISGFGDSGYFTTAALDIARTGWVTPGNVWLIRLWPPGFMVLEAVLMRVLGENGPVLLALLLLSALLCATWMLLLRRFLLARAVAPRVATAAPLLPFVFPLTWMFLLSPHGLSLGETFAVSLFLCAFLLLLLAATSGSIRHAALAGLALAVAAYFRSQFELVVQFLTLGGVLLAALALVGKLRNWHGLTIGRSVLVAAVCLLVAHAAMAPWRYYNQSTSGKSTWVFTSGLVYQNALQHEKTLYEAGGSFVIAGGGNLACKLEPTYCGKNEANLFWSAFFNHPVEWVMEKARRLPAYWMTPGVVGALSMPSPPTLLQGLANIVLLAGLLYSLWRLWGARRDPEFAVQAWVQLSLYACLAGVYTMVHLEARYLYLPKIFGVVALLTLLWPSPARRPAPVARVAGGDAPLPPAVAPVPVAARAMAQPGAEALAPVHVPVAEPRAVEPSFEPAPAQPAFAPGAAQSAAARPVEARAAAAVPAAVAVSVVIPVYRSERILPILHKRLIAALEPAVASFEVLFVEDCGGDASWTVLQQLAAADPRIRAVKLSRNYGQHNALLCGIRAARGDVVVTIDDDLQNPPEEIPRLLAKLAEGHDVVYGSPRAGTHGVLRNMASRITKLALQSAMGVDSASKVSAFRAFRTKLRDAFDAYRSPSVNIDVLLTWGTSRFASVDVPQDPRHSGDSGYSLRKLIAHAVNMMTGFSVLPLQIASVAGVAAGLVGFAIMAYVVGRFLLFGSSVPGFTFLVSVIAIFSGIQLLALGIFGEYLARMHFRSMDRPPYSEAERTPPRA